MGWIQIRFGSEEVRAERVVELVRKLWAANGSHENATVYYRPLDDGCSIVFDPHASTVFEQSLNSYDREEISQPADLERLAVIYRS